MDGYVVLLRHTMDDLPLALFGSHADAVAFAKTVDWMPTDKVRDILGTDCSTPCVIAIAEFREGLLYSLEIVRDIEQEQEQPAS